MTLIEFIQKFFLFLLPGACGTLLFDALIIRKGANYYIELLRLVFLSFVSFFIVDCIFGIIRKFIPCFIYAPIDIVHQIGANEVSFPTANVIVAILFSLIIACILVKARSENWVFKFANRFKLSRRIDNQPVWERAFDDNNIVVLRDQITNNTYYGVVSSFSDNSEIREMILSNVDVYNELSEFLYHTEHLYISRAHNEFTIETYDYSADKDKESAGVSNG